MSPTPALPLLPDHPDIFRTIFQLLPRQTQLALLRVDRRVSRAAFPLLYADITCSIARLSPALLAEPGSRPATSDTLRVARGAIRRVTVYDDELPDGWRCPAFATRGELPGLEVVRWMGLGRRKRSGEEDGGDEGQEEEGGKNPWTQGMLFNPMGSGDGLPNLFFGLGGAQRELPYEDQRAFFTEPAQRAMACMIEEETRGRGRVAEVLVDTENITPSPTFVTPAAHNQDLSDLARIPQHLPSTLSPNYSSILYPAYPVIRADPIIAHDPPPGALTSDTDISLCPLWTIPARHLVLSGDMGLVALLQPDTMALLAPEVEEVTFVLGPPFELGRFTPWPPVFQQRRGSALRRVTVVLDPQGKRDPGGQAGHERDGMSSAQGHGHGHGHGHGQGNVEGLLGGIEIKHGELLVEWFAALVETLCVDLVLVNFGDGPSGETCVRAVEPSSPLATPVPTPIPAPAPAVAVAVAVADSDTAAPNRPIETDDLVALRGPPPDYAERDPALAPHGGSRQSTSGGPADPGCVPNGSPTRQQRHWTRHSLGSTSVLTLDRLRHLAEEPPSDPSTSSHAERSARPPEPEVEVEADADMELGTSVTSHQRQWTPRSLGSTSVLTLDRLRHLAQDPPGDVPEADANAQTEADADASTNVLIDPAPASTSTTETAPHGSGPAYELLFGGGLANSASVGRLRALRDARDPIRVLEQSQDARAALQQLGIGADHIQTRTQRGGEGFVVLAPPVPPDVPFTFQPSDAPGVVSSSDTGTGPGRGVGTSNAGLHPTLSPDVPTASTGTRSGCSLSSDAIEANLGRLAWLGGHPCRLRSYTAGMVRRELERRMERGPGGVAGPSTRVRTLTPARTRTQSGSRGGADGGGGGGGSPSMRGSQESEAPGGSSNMDLSAGADVAHGEVGGESGVILWRGYEEWSRQCGAVLGLRVPGAHREL